MSNIKVIISNLLIALILGTCAIVIGNVLALLLLEHKENKESEVETKEPYCGSIGTYRSSKYADRVYCVNADGSDYYIYTDREGNVTISDTKIEEH